jgi:hypothetical protein
MAYNDAAVNLEPSQQQFREMIAEAREAVMAASSADMPQIFREHAHRLLTPPQDRWQRQRIINALQDLRDDVHPKLSHKLVRQTVQEIPRTEPTRNSGTTPNDVDAVREELAAQAEQPAQAALSGTPEDEGEDERLPSLSQESEQVIDGLAENAGGLLGEFIQYVTNTARYPNRTLALGAAVTVIGTLIGRRVATPTRSATHLYVVCLAPTGAGKQHPLNCATRAMKAAGAVGHIGPSSFMSQSAVVNHLREMPLSLCPMDEFGSFLKKVHSLRASTHERAVSMVLRPAWGTSFEIMMTPEWAGRKAVKISSPALSILGMSTPREYHESLKSSDIENGLTNRLLVLSIDELPDEVTPQSDIDRLPESLAAGLADLFNWNGSNTRLDIARLNDPDLEPEPVLLEWGDGAENFYKEFSRAARDRVRADDQYGDLHAREAEIAVRLATIRAAGFRSERGRGGTRPAFGRDR